MILVDTSVWIDHLRKSDATLQRLLGDEKVLSHPFVIGEISLGSFKSRDDILNELKSLPEAAAANPGEVLQFITQHRLFGVGIGYVDVHLLAAAQLTPRTTLWTRDKRLRNIAQGLGLDYRN